MAGDASLWAVFGSGLLGSLVGGTITLGATVIQARRSERAAAQEWLRTAGYPALHRVLAAARQVDEWKFAAGFIAGFGADPGDAVQTLEKELDELRSALNDIEVFCSPELASAAHAIATEAAAAVTEARGNPETAEQIRTVQPPPPDQVRTLARLRRELVQEIRKELGIERGRRRR